MDVLPSMGTSTAWRNGLAGHINFNKKLKVLPLWSNSSRHKKVLGANQLANSLAEILPWLLHTLAGVPCLNPTEGSRLYLPASSSDCLDLCRSPQRDVKTVFQELGMKFLVLWKALGLLLKGCKLKPICA